MKIAILTQPLGKNYGGIMQAWALQQVINRGGFSSITIDRQPDRRGYLHQTARIIYHLLLKMIGKNKGAIRKDRCSYLIESNTKKFIANNLNISEPLNSTQQLIEYFDINNYDAVVVGSDQTWRPIYSPNILNFFLDFLAGRDLKKIAYACSFGVDQWEFSKKQTEYCSSLAKHFDFISVREASGVELCRNHLGVNAELVLDPTLLLTKSEYVDLLNRADCLSRSTGVFTYFLDKTLAKNNLANNIALRTGVHVFDHYENETTTSTVDCGEVQPIPPVEKWLSCFNNADFVVTDSFHGMVFSIIFEKPFLVVDNKRRGSARFTSLLSLLGLEKRLVECSVSEVDKFLDKNDVLLGKKILINLRELSLTHLFENLAKK